MFPLGCEKPVFWLLHYRRYQKTTEQKRRMGDAAWFQLGVMAVVAQSAFALCPLQTLLRPLVSNTLQASSSFKQNPHDTFIIASSLIRGPFQKWLNNPHLDEALLHMCRHTRARVQTHNICFFCRLVD